MAAFILATSGLRVLLLEAGRDYDPIRETPMFQLPKDAPLRAAGTPEKPFGFYDATVDGGWQVPGEPYSVADGSEFLWWRSRMLGGRTNHWGRISLRMGEYDFKPHSRDGLGFDWPMEYEDLAPYYDRTEALIGVYGSNEGLENTPNSSPGVLQQPPRPRAYELLTRKACRRMGIPVIPAHLAIMTQTQDADRLPGEIFPGNDLARRVTADSMRRARRVLLGDAVRTRLLDPRQLSVDHRPAAPRARHGEPRGAHGGDGPRGHRRFAGAGDRGSLRRQIHAARRIRRGTRRRACRECLRVRAHPAQLHEQPLPRWSGKFLTASSASTSWTRSGAGVYAHIPALQALPPHNEDGASAMHMYMPWWLYGEQLAGQLDFPRGYHIEFGGGRRMPGFGAFSGLEPLTGGSYGRRFKDDCRRYYGSFLFFDGRGEMIPNEDCYCEIDPDKVDRYGIPVLRFHWKWADHELNQALHMQRTFAEIVDEMGGQLLTTVASNGADAISRGGEIIHEVGGARMGDDPRTSVLNEFGQSWDVPNLFVTDGAPFVSNADKNPTLSIMAIAWRASDYIVEQLRQRSIG